MIFVPSLGAVISNGDFLFALSSPEATNPSVCRIHSTIHPDQLVVNWWLTNIELTAMGVEQVPPPIPVHEYLFLKKCRLIEVSELSSSYSTIKVNFVKDISFVFHADMLEEEQLNCAGMSRVYYTRYSYHINNQAMSVTRHQHSPFSTCILESFPSRIWYSILHIKQAVEKQLNDTKQYQACKKMLMLQCSLEAWHYISSRILSSDAALVYFRRNHTQKQMHCDLALSSRNSKQYLTMMRLDTLQSLNCAREIFGWTFGIGVRNRAPCKNEAAVTLHNGDIVNIVDVSSNLYDVSCNVPTNRHREFTIDQGIDFIYEQYTRTLKIRIRYCKKNAHLPIVLTSLRLNIHDFPQQNNNNNANNDLRSMWAQQVKPGICFFLSGVIVEVISVDGDSVVVVPDDSVTQQRISLLEAAELLRLYIG